MKLKSYILAIAILTTVFTGCHTSKNTYDSSKIIENHIAEDFPAESGELIPEFNLTQSEFNDACNQISNIKYSETVETILPNNVSAVYRYKEFGYDILDMKAAYNEFKEIFVSIFPNHTFNDEALFFYHSEEEPYKKVAECMEELFSGEFGRVSLEYDETRIANVSSEQDAPVYLYTAYPAGYGATCFNKGKLALLMNTGCLLGSFSPRESLKYVAEYPPDSTQKIKLLNGEIAINEAVAVFEDYVNNNISIPKESNCKTAVWWTEVYQITEDTYGIAFLTTMEVKNVLYDYMENGTMHSAHESAPLIGEGFMLETDDVDYVSSYYRKLNATDITSYNEIISFADALKITSENLTNEVIFDLKKVEFVYSRFFETTSDGYIKNPDSPVDTVVPEWKITLYNPNDDYLYVCYVEAVDEHNLRYEVRYNRELNNEEDINEEADS